MESGNNHALVLSHLYSFLSSHRFDEEFADHDYYNYDPKNVELSPSGDLPTQAPPTSTEPHLAREEREVPADKEIQEATSELESSGSLLDMPDYVNFDPSDSSPAMTTAGSASEREPANVPESEVSPPHSQENSPEPSKKLADPSAPKVLPKPKSKPKKQHASDLESSGSSSSSPDSPLSVPKHEKPAPVTAASSEPLATTPPVPRTVKPVSRSVSIKNRALMLERTMRGEDVVDEEEGVAQEEVWLKEERVWFK